MHVVLTEAECHHVIFCVQLFTVNNALDAHLAICRRLEHHEKNP